MKKTSRISAKAGKRTLREKKPSEATAEKKAPSRAKRAASCEVETVPPRKVEFHFFGIEARDVFLCGDFNSWDIHSLPLEKNLEGEWEAVVSLAPGRYEFKTVADGLWIENGYCEVRMEGTDFTLSLPLEWVFNSFGTRNLVFTLR